MGFFLPGKLPQTRCAAVIVLLLSCLLPPTAGAETFAGKRILSFDLGYLGTGLKNNGWGLGLSYEAELLRRLAVKGGFSHMSLWPSDSDMTVTTVGIQLEALCYPFGRGLDWLYVGGACGTDFIMYKGGAVADGKQNDAIISLLGEIGWKQNFFDYVMADAFFGYRFPLNHGDQAFSSKITRRGFEYGVRVKLNLPMIFRRIFRRQTAASPADKTEPNDTEKPSGDETEAAGPNRQDDDRSESPATAETDRYA